MMGATHWVEEDGVVSAQASLPIGTTPAAWMLVAAIAGGAPSNSARFVSKIRRLVCENKKGRIGKIYQN
jgi:hypothetical protein